MTVVDLATHRREKISGSEAASACGVDPFRSRIMLWAEKTGRIERPETEAMRWGTLLEPVVFGELERQGFEVMPAPAAEWMHDTEWWMTGHVDGFVAVDGVRGVLEVKTAGHWSGHDWSSDSGAPLQYLVQVHHYMAITGCDVGLLACLVGGQRLELRTVYADLDVTEQMILREQELLNYIRTDQPPPPDGSSSAHDAIRALHPEANGQTMRLSRAGWENVLALRERKEQLEIVKRQAAELQQAIELEMGDATHAISPFDTPAARWPTVQSTRLDSKALKAARPDVHSEFAVATSTRRFTLE
jgi:putative phage-type endonuclease